ncbi:MAG: hypothetical protein LQ340_007988 [Diploschistes diacapsis]|nr:MAG: hypothetical protein LQ340_007988 [Diploschistes diacapsis]
MQKGEGCYLWDIENRRYLDFTGGIAVNSLGHCDPGFTKLISHQANTLVHCSNLYHNPWTGPLSKLLVQKTLASGGMYNAARVFTCNSGTEANEAALKFARKVGSMRSSSSSSSSSSPKPNPKHELLSFTSSFHGRTMGSLSATPNPKYQAPFAPLIPGFRHAPFNSTTDLDSLITASTCGVIVEPVQGEGGIHAASVGFLQALRARCSAVGAVLIYDEIQCGLGRTGALWAHSRLPRDAHPDMVTSAKALGNGFPVGAVVVSDAVARCVAVGDHGTTFGGSPLASRLAHYCVGRLADPRLHAHVRRMGALFAARFDRLRARFPRLVAETRGIGLLLGLQLTRDPAALVAAARERGLLLITAGTNTLRFAPPLVVSEREVEEGMAILESAMEEVVGRESEGA